MELGKHLGKGLWGLADKALPVVYGIAYVILVIRVLPEEEFGNFVLIQEIFLIVTGLAMAFALQPLLKFAAEENTDLKAILSSALLLNIGFILMASVLVVALREPFGSLLNSPRLSPLMLYLPVMFAASFVRNYTLILLQSRFQIKQVFWVDAVHFVGAPVLIYVYSKMNLFDSALDLIVINIVSLSASSVIGFWLSRSMMRFQLRPEKGEFIRVWDYGKYSLGGLMSYMVYSKADSFILSAFGGPLQVAVYNSVKVFIRVFDMVPQIAQMIILPATAKLISRGDFTSMKNMVEKAINFSTVAMVPVCVTFLIFASPIVTVIYQGRYQEAIPLLRIFGLLALMVPLVAVASNTLMGLGQARLSFILSMVFLVVSIILYLIVIPLLGTLGATIGYLTASLFLAVMMSYYLNRFVPVTILDVLRRTRDITDFVRTRFLNRMP